MVRGVLSDSCRIPVIGFIAAGGTGKTTLLCRILPLLKSRDLRIGVVKQARDDFDVDKPGKDSYRLRKAGVERLLLTSSRKSALMIEHPEGPAPQLETLLNLLDQNALDLILVEGFSEMPFPKIELIRLPKGKPRYRDDPWVVALAATDRIESTAAPVPVLDINDPAGVVHFILTYFGLLQTKQGRD
jgi:molybdopterin-guanine dinucleotide biosynthesis protein B